MSRFDHYFQMNVGDVIEYTLEKATEIPSIENYLRVDVMHIVGK